MWCICHNAEWGGFMTEIKNAGPRKGVLLVNLGTPAAPERGPVARFLREFLSDPRVVDLPRLLWLPLLYGVIVPLRAGRSAAAYREIWMPEGSPLLVYTQRLAARLSELLAGEAAVAVGMRYGEPSIRNELERMRTSGVQDLVIIPLYPQFSYTTTASIYDAVDRALADSGWAPRVHRVQQYFDHPRWVEAVADSIRAFREAQGAPEKLVFSLHGIPQRYVKQGDPYQDQCEKSAQAVAESLGLDPAEWLLTYQSRVGREPWLQPYTDETMKKLGSSGVRHVQVVCPGFAVDCLETLEEIAMQNRAFFTDAGGGSFHYIPALNDSESHARVMEALAREQFDGTGA